MPSSFGRWRTSSRSTNVRTIRFDPSSAWTRRASNSSGRRGIPMDAEPGQPRRVDYEYERKGVADLFMFFEPLRGWRRVWITPQRRKVEWAWCVKQLLDEHYPAGGASGPGLRQPEYPHGWGTVRGVSRRGGEAIVGAAGGPLHSQARQLVEYGGDRTERPFWGVIRCQFIFSSNPVSVHLFGQE